MAKEWILQNAMERYQYNFKRNVGATSEAIRKCSPRSVDEWKDYYYSNIRSESHIEELGRRLYVKITEVIQSEVQEVTEEDCIDYMKQMVIDRTFAGYMTEITTIYGQLQAELECKIEPASDEWDRHYNVDFFINVNGKYIGLQIKPVNAGIQLPEIFKEYSIQHTTQEEFTKKFGGKVFYLFSTKINGKKVILNTEVIGEIKAEIQRLSKI